MLVNRHRGAGPPRVLFVELKLDGGRLTAAQQWWANVLAAAGAAWQLWRPRDWPHIQRVLRGD